VEAAPAQPGTTLVGYCGKTGETIRVYIDKDGEACDESTVRFLLTRGASSSRAH
jgi:hypothetical protein